jgi:chromosome segregation ATPase
MSDLKEIKTKVTDIEKLQKIILEKIDNLDKKINLINENNTEIKKECNKIGSHIDFIEDTYSILQIPINYVKKTIECLTGNTTKDTNNSN